MNENNIEIASKVLGITVEEAKMNQKEIPELSATIFWKSGRGGGKVIINDEGERLFGASGISPTLLIEEFKNGRRS